MGAITNLQEKPTAQEWADFLANTPPEVHTEITDLGIAKPGAVMLATPDIKLHCTYATCGGIRFFQNDAGSVWLSTSWKDTFLDYSCRNCRRSVKTYAVRVKQATDASKNGQAYKFGEV